MTIASELDRVAFDAGTARAQLCVWAINTRWAGEDGFHAEAAEMFLEFDRLAQIGAGTTDEALYAEAALHHWAERSHRYPRRHQRAAELWERLAMYVMQGQRVPAWR